MAGFGLLHQVTASLVFVPVCYNGSMRIGNRTRKEEETKTYERKEAEAR